MFELTAEKGASNWLNTFPIEEKGYALHKGDFRDALALRYCLPVKNLPTNCVCGQSFNVEHAMICKTGGFLRSDMTGLEIFLPLPWILFGEELALSLICSLSAVKFSDRLLKTHLTKRVLTSSATISGREALRLI